MKFYIEDIPEEELPLKSWKGKVLISDRVRRQRNKRILIALFLLTLPLFLWLYFFFRKPTEEEAFREKLRFESEIVQLREGLESTIFYSSSTEEIKEAIRKLLLITQTPLTQKEAYHSFLIPARYLAIVNSLEALLKLKLERFVGEEGEEAKKFYRRTLFHLSDLPLEYYRESSHQQKPLIPLLAEKKAQQIEKRKRIESNAVTYTEHELDELLQEWENGELFSLIIPSLNLGRWFWYQNQREEAERCFHLGRMYVEGLEKGKGPFLPGISLTDLGSEWNGYFLCLRSLVEISLQEKEFRKARSYLMRMFHLPRESLFKDPKHDLIEEQVKENQERIQQLEGDIERIKRVLREPELLVHFPLLNEEDRAVFDWEQIVAQLIDQEAKNSLPFKFWNEFSLSLQNFLMQATTEELSRKVKNQLIEKWNHWIQRESSFSLFPQYYRQLSRKGRAILSKSRTTVLLPEEFQALNREILEIGFQFAISSPFQLSDGSRLSNQLNQREREELLQLYQKELEETSREDPYWQQIKVKMHRIEKGEETATFAKFLSIIERRTYTYDQSIRKREEQFDAIRMELRAIYEEIKQLEEQQSLFEDTLKEFRAKESTLRHQLSFLSFEKEQLSDQREDILQKKERLLNRFRKRINAIERERRTLNEQHHDLFDNYVEEESSLVDKIERELFLRKKLLTLLEGIHREELGERILSIQENIKKIQEEILPLKERLQKTKGEEREQLVIRIRSWEKKEHALTMELDAIYAPVREIAGELYREEKEIWEVERAFQENRHAIEQIIGSEKIQGELEANFQERKALITMDADQLFSHPEYNEKIQKINDQISLQHSRLEVLLQKEEILFNKLKLFSHVQKDSLFRKQFIDQLHTQLREQRELFEKYDLLFKEKNLLYDIYFQEKILLDHLRILRQDLEETELSEQLSRDISRYLQVILLTGQKLKKNRQNLKSLQELGKISPLNHSSSAYHLELLEMYQMEGQIGFDASLYQQTFEKRKQLLLKLNEAIENKNFLEEQKREEKRKQYPIQLKFLEKQLQLVEKVISSYSEQLIEKNRQLILFAREYENRWEKISHFRTVLLSKIQNMEKNWEEQLQNIEEKMREMKGVIHRILQVQLSLNRDIFQVNMEEIEQMIGSQRERLQQLQEELQILLLEHYYKSETIWLTGYTFFQESLLSSYEELKNSQKISETELEREKRLGKWITREFDTEWIYSKEMFYQKEEEDQQRANYLHWIDFSEQTALYLFLDLLPKYIPLSFSSDLPQSIPEKFFKRIRRSQAFSVRGRFLSGWIHMRRAWKQARGSSSSISENKQAQQSWKSAENIFNELITSTEPLIFDKNHNILQHRILGAHSFPEEQFEVIDFTNHARLYRGIINSIREEEPKAIAEYRALVKKIFEIDGISLDFLMQEGEEEVPPLGQLHLSSLTKVSYDLYLHPQYSSLASQEPLLPELIYRLGKSYQKWAEKEYREWFNAREEEPKFPPRQALSHAYRAINYYSQFLTLERSHPYYLNALFSRAQLYQMYDHWELAKKDWLYLFSLAPDKERDLSSQGISFKGELEAELFPEKAQIALQMGLAALKAKDYRLAEETLFWAQESTSSLKLLAEIKLAFIHTLLEIKDWPRVLFFTDRLIEEREQISEEQRHLFPIDLYLYRAIARRELFDLKGAKENLYQLFALAPYRLLDKWGVFHLRDSQGLRMLKTDYRDLIHAFAQGCLHLGEIYIALKKYTEAEEQFSYAHTLFQLIPWKEDRTLQQFSHSDYRQYKGEKLLRARWGKMKSEILQFFFSLFTDYRKDLFLDLSLQEIPPESQIEQSSSQMIQRVASHREEIEQFSTALSSLLKEEWEKLPEILEKTRKEEQKEAIQISNREQFQKYQLFVEEWKKLRQNKEISGYDLLRKIGETYHVDSVEYAIWEECIRDILPSLHLTADDRLQMQVDRADIENLLRIREPEKRLEPVSHASMQWFEERIGHFPFDTIFLPLSPQREVLEEMILYKISLLNLLGDYSSYDEMKKLIGETIEREGMHPRQIYSSQIFVQLLKNGLLLAKKNEEWELVERWTQLLLEDRFKRFFSSSRTFSLERIKLYRVESLLKLREKNLALAEENRDREIKILLTEKSEAQNREAKEFLEELSTLPGKEAIPSFLRIHSRQLLQKFT